MVGAIGKLEVLAHPLVTIECFGWTVFFRAVLAGRGQTFLSLLGQSGAFRVPEPPAAEFILRCENLERRAMRIYQTLARRHFQLELVREFFLHLAQQEQIHAELLEVCRVAAGRKRGRDVNLDPWRSTVPQTERLLEEAEEALERHPSLADSLRLVIRMESSQINGLLLGVVRATDWRFVQVFSAFRQAVRDHLEYIRERIPLLEPSLSAECNQLEAAVY